jgi:phospholipid-transporting ATPase
MFIIIMVGVKCTKNLGSDKTEGHRHKLKGNKINTSKYNWITFLPLAIIVQFRRLANFFFVGIVILQAIPAIQTVPLYLAVLPITFVFVVSVIREFIEEIKRRKHDKTMNNMGARVLRESKFHDVKWKDLRVGDILIIHDGEDFPADIVILKCSDKYGTAYIQTMTLDGERALKPRQALMEIQHGIKDQKVSLNNLKFKLKYDLPTPEIYQFKCEIDMQTPKLETLQMSIDQFFLRGAKLSNTDWAIGIIVYAGHDTKLLKNMMKTTYKISRAERILNSIFLLVIGFLVVL